MHIVLLTGRIESSNDRLNALNGMTNAIACRLSSSMGTLYGEAGVTILGGKKKGE